MPTICWLFVLLGLSTVYLHGAEAAAATCSSKTMAVVASTTSPTLPLNGGPTELPAAMDKLLFVAVGKGIQNYTCTAGSPPISDGALATLYDTTSLAFSDISLVHKMPPFCVNIPAVFPKGAITIPGIGSFPVLGQHFFTPQLVPTFNLTAEKKIFYGKKLLAINAPKTAAEGPARTGAVPWLQLGDYGSSIGISEGYRVVTAGGNAPTLCTTDGVISIQYCAEYWFYG